MRTILRLCAIRDSPLVIVSKNFTVKALFSDFLKPKSASVSLDSLRSPPPTGSFEIKNAYIPITRRTLIRELLQDTDTIAPHERDTFEQVAIALDRKLANQFHVIQNELSLLSQVVEPIVSAADGAVSSPAHQFTPFRPLTDTERSDQQFWLLRRLSELAPAAGFIEVTREELERACNPRRVQRETAVSYVDPKDYHVIRFWIRGVHPCLLRKPLAPPNPSKPANETTDTTTANSPDRQTNTAGPVVPVWLRMTLKRAASGLGRFAKRIWTEPDPFRVRRKETTPQICAPKDLCFGKVLLAVQTANEERLHVKLYENVPSSAPSCGHVYTEHLGYLLPELRYRPLGTGGRLALLASSATALGCLGLVAPMAWLLTPNPDLVLAWSVAATASAGATVSLVWARYWRAQTKLTNWLKQLHYECGQNTGSQTLSTLLKLAFEEQFKAALLAYALLLRPSEADSPISPIQLGIRAESWIAKRLSPRNHLALPSSFRGPVSLRPDEFTGGSGPLFDLVFDADRALTVLRRLDLVRGPSDSPKALPVATAATALRDDAHSTGTGLHRLWLLDPLVDELELGRPK